jgi:hypothetical protein
MPTQRDIPGRIAQWLFRIGIIWAVILVPFTIVAFLSVFGRGTGFWQLGIYALVGFGVWGGWRWRSRQRRSLRAAAAFWLFSAAFNSAFVVYLIATESQWSKILIYDQTAFYAWWWIAVTMASLVAFGFEFTLQRDETPAA